MKTLILAAALAAAMPALPAFAGDGHQGYRIVIADGRGHGGDGYAYLGRPYFDGYSRSARRAERRFERRQQRRLERRFIGRYIGDRPREIRRNLRRLGFRAIDIDRDGRRYEVEARRRGRELEFEVSRRSGRIIDVDRD